MDIDLTCFVYEGWKPRLRPAPQRRLWMDQTPEAFAYRCLPLNIANSCGWELLSPCGFEATWNGGQAAEDVAIRLDVGVDPTDVPVALFGAGTLTFHVQGLFRTPPGWNLWVSGPPNLGKDAIVPLSGMIETDWSPYSFTMNWRFTRPHHTIRFEADEPFCWFMPIERGLAERVTPRIAPIEDAPELKRQFEAWSRSRDAFHAAVRADPPSKPADKWQKLYYRGVDPDGVAQVSDHRAKLRLRPFAASRCPVGVERPEPSVAAPEESAASSLALQKRDWLLRTQQRLRGLSPNADALYRRADLNGPAFLDQHYSTNRPVVIADLARDWSARRLWSPAYLSERLGETIVEVQSKRSSDPAFERRKEAHRERTSFAAFVAAVQQPATGNDLYLTAYNASANAEALAPLKQDLGFPEAFLSRDLENPDGMMWIGGEGAFTPLHHDLTNNLLVQITGRKSIVLVSPFETPNLYNDEGVFSLVSDLLEPRDLKEMPLLAGVRAHRIVLEPGDALFLPVGWWHQVRSLEFSVSITYTNFLWPNEAHETYPAG